MNKIANRYASFFGLFFLSLMVLTACSMFQNKELITQLGTQYAVLKFIGDGPDAADKAHRARLVIDFALAAVNQDTASVDTLEQKIREKIDWMKYDNANKLLLNTAITATKQDILNAVGPEGTISPDKIVKVRQVLITIRQAIDMSGY